MSTRKIHTWSTLSCSICHAVSSTITSRNITQHRKQNVFSSFERSFGSFWLVLLVVLGGFSCFWLVLAGNYERFAQALALQMETQTVEVKVCIHSFLFYKNLVFPAQAEYSYFSADFWLKHSCIILK